MTTKKKWLLFDSRYLFDEDIAICFEVCDTLKEAKETAPDYGDDTVIVEYDTFGNELINPKIIQ